MLNRSQRTFNLIGVGPLVKTIQALLTARAAGAGGVSALEVDRRGRGSFYVKLPQLNTYSTMILDGSLTKRAKTSKFDQIVRLKRNTSNPKMAEGKKSAHLTTKY